jgi:hypothetical protein
MIGSFPTQALASVALFLLGNNGVNSLSSASGVELDAGLFSY